MNDCKNEIQKDLKYHLISIPLIFIFGGMLEMVLTCGKCFDEPYFLSSTFFVRYFYNALAWLGLWKGSEFLVIWLDSVMPWLRSVYKRFVASVLSIVIYVFLLVWTLDLFFDLIIFNRTLSEALEVSGAPLMNVMVVTLIINIFMHGRGFLLSWRQTSIDMERLRTEQVSTQYNSLKNQVNPHFLFNSLNALSSLVYEDQDRAVEFIRKLSQVYRYVLESKDEEVVPLEKEMEFVKNFTFLQKIRFGDNLKVDVVNSEPSAFVPPLAIQILVENAIKHNVVSEKDPLSVKIVINDKECIVSNSIKEKNAKDSTGIGLQNLIDRYQYLSDQEVTINNEAGMFEVTLPLLKVIK